MAIDSVLRRFEKWEDRGSVLPHPTADIHGKIVSKYKAGDRDFITVEDSTDQVEVYLKPERLANPDLINKLCIGDRVVICGGLYRNPTTKDTILVPDAIERRDRTC